MKTLYLKRMGMDIYKTSPFYKKSDVGNFRVRTTNYNVIGKNGKKYFLEFTIDHRYNSLHVDICYKCDTGFTYSDYKLFLEMTQYSRFEFTLSDILRFTNAISETQYNKIELV